MARLVSRYRCYKYRRRQRAIDPEGVSRQTVVSGPTEFRIDFMSSMSTSLESCAVCSSSRSSSSFTRLSFNAARRILSRQASGAERSRKSQPHSECHSRSKFKVHVASCDERIRFEFFFFFSTTCTIFYSSQNFTGFYRSDLP